MLAYGEAVAVIKKAQAEALRLRSESESAYLKMLNESVGKEGAVKIVLANKILDAYTVSATKSCKTHRITHQAQFRNLEGVSVPANRA